MAIMDVKFKKDKIDAIQQLELISSSNSNAPTIHGAFGVWKSLLKGVCRRSGTEYTVLPRVEVIRKIKDTKLRDNFECIQHLDRFPVMASDVATLELADVYASEGLLDESVTLLERFLDEQSDMVTLVAADKEYSLHPNGYFISTIKRPSAHAVHKLIDLYSRQGKPGAAIVSGEAFGQKLSEDGWYHELINEPLARTLTLV
jgi:hypothetical protein